MATTKQIKSEIKKLAKMVEKTISERERHFVSKSDNWQYSSIGDKYFGTTEELRIIHESLNESLLSF